MAKTVLHREDGLFKPKHVGEGILRDNTIYEYAG